VIKKQRRSVAAIVGFALLALPRTVTTTKVEDGLFQQILVIGQDVALDYPYTLSGFTHGIDAPVDNCGIRPYRAVSCNVNYFRANPC
jgi:hypothetical protein